jgi:hypothetical protein
MFVLKQVGHYQSVSSGLPVTWSVFVTTGSLGAVTYNSRLIIRIFSIFFSSKSSSFFVVGVSVSLVVPPQIVSTSLSPFHLGCPLISAHPPILLGSRVLTCSP